MLVVGAEATESFIRRDAGVAQNLIAQPWRAPTQQHSTERDPARVFFISRVGSITTSATSSFTPPVW